MKRIVSLIMLFVVAISLVSCGEKEPKPEGDGEPRQDETESIDLRIVYKEAGNSIATTGGGNEDGFYVLTPRIYQPDSNEQHCNIVYTDYKTKTQVYLCNDLSCRHNTDECSSFVSISKTSAAIFPVKNKLVLFKYGASIGMAESEDDLCSVTIMDLDGKNRERICAFDAKETVNAPIAAQADGEILYFQVISLDEDLNTIKKLVSVNLKNGQKSIETNLPASYQLVSAYDDCLVFFDTEQFVDMVYSLSSKSMKKGMIASEMYDGSKSVATKIEGSTIQDRIKASEISIISYDFKEEKTSELGPYPLEDGHGIAGLIGLHDDHVMIEYIKISDNAEEIIRNCVDLNSGKAVKNDMFFSSSGMIRPVSIIADAGDSYLVFYNTIQITQTYYDSEGVAHSFDNDAYPQYALIKKEDYWNNITNFIPIDDKTM